MLRKSFVALLAAAAAQALPAQTVDEVVAKSIEARGGLAKLKAVETVRITGKMAMGPGFEAPVTLELKRPNQMRIEFTFQGMTGVQAFDGAAGWQLMPFRGRKTAEPMSPDEQKQAAQQADIDGPLVDWQAKGHQVELLGKEPVEGAEAHKLKVTLKDGDVQYVYLDAEHFIEVRSEQKRMIRGSEVEGESSFSDYKEVAGVMFPHAIDSGAKGHAQRQKLTVEKIEVNVPLGADRFQMPEPPPAAAEPPAAPAAQATPAPQAR